MRGGGLNDHLARNATDRLLMHVNWVFEINFRPALQPTPHVTRILSKARSYLTATLTYGPKTDPNPPAQS